MLVPAVECPKAQCLIFVPTASEQDLGLLPTEFIFILSMILRTDTCYSDWFLQMHSSLRCRLHLYAGLTHLTLHFSWNMSWLKQLRADI